MYAGNPVAMSTEQIGAAGKESKEDPAGKIETGDWIAFIRSFYSHSKPPPPPQNSPSSSSSLHHHRKTIQLQRINHSLQYHSNNDFSLLPIHDNNQQRQWLLASTVLTSLVVVN